MIIHRIKVWISKDIWLKLNNSLDKHLKSVQRIALKNSFTIYQFDQHTYQHLFVFMFCRFEKIIKIERKGLLLPDFNSFFEQMNT